MMTRLVEMEGLSAGDSCYSNLSISVTNISLSRRKSALPKYEPPYIKRPMMVPAQSKGYSHPNSPHPSQQHMTPDHTGYQEEGNKMMSYPQPNMGYKSHE